MLPKVPEIKSSSAELDVFITLTRRTSSIVTFSVSSAPAGQDRTG